MLAACPHGRTVANMLAHGFTNAMLDGLERDRLVILQPGTVRTGTRRITVVWVPRPLRISAYGQSRKHNT
jgi:hypothetical protein